MKHLATRGFTMIELLVVITIMVILLGTTVAGFRSYARYQEYDAAVSGVKIALASAQAKARAAQSDKSHGAKFLTTSVVTFEGATYSAGASNNITYSFPNVRITPALTGSVTELTFSPVTGLPNVTGTITIVGTTHEATTTVTITGAGVIQ